MLQVDWKRQYSAPAAFKSSATASGSAVCASREPTGIRAPKGAFSHSRSKIRQVRVSTLPKELPMMTHKQAFTGSCSAKSANAPMVITMEQSCSATSTAANVPMRLAAVKYPVMTPHRQETGKNAAKSRSASTVLGSPIQTDATHGAKLYKSAAIQPLKAML